MTGSYPIEVTRQQSFAETGAADTRYDNNIFLITLERGMYGFVVEQGNITNPDNIFDPATLLNFRLTPVRNLMRWYKSIINSYPNISNSEAKLFFSAGTGNLIAEGEITQGFYADPCKLENMVISESQNLFITHFADQDDATPLWKNETLTYEYPLSVEGYAALKASPYGYISAQCGDGDYLKGFIQEVKFKLSKGYSNIYFKEKMGIMKLAEFNARWTGDYTPDEEQQYRAIHGDDRADWPCAETVDKICIDLDKLVRFNPAKSETETTVELSCGGTYALKISYDDFKDLLAYYSIEITDHLK